jgi:hypothetical protein
MSCNSDEAKQPVTVPTKGLKWHPTKRQRALCELLADFDDPRTVAEKCVAAGVSDDLFHRWLRDGRFFDFMVGMLGFRAQAEIAEVWKALLTEAKAGKVQATRLLLDWLGRWCLRDPATGAAGADAPAASEAALRFREHIQDLDPELVRRLFAGLEGADAGGAPEREGAA